jgi:hypothetical protein
VFIDPSCADVPKASPLELGINMALQEGAWASVYLLGLIGRVLSGRTVCFQ